MCTAYQITNSLANMLAKILSACLLFVIHVSAQVINKDYCVVGAGPSGLQLGHFLQKANRDYIILEKSSHAGSFYDKYPRHGKLISINKRYTDSENTEYCLRHDWNSLISDDHSLLYKHYSKEMFPARDTMLKYLHDFQTKLNIKVEFNTEVKDIWQAGAQFEIETDQHKYLCNVVVIATGLSKPRELDLPGKEHMIGYETMSLNQTDYEGKRVLIVGKGNSGFEIANHLYGHTKSVHMMSRNTVRLSWSTHYVGDVRGVNNEVLDSYQLKSLDGLFETKDQEWGLVKMPDGMISVQINEPKMKQKAETNETHKQEIDREKHGIERFEYDIIVRAVGFVWDDSLTKGIHSVQAGKYPLISHQYESTQMENMFFAGTVTHSLDFQKAAGGFIHGFRYTVRALHRYLESRRHGVPWPTTEAPLSNLVDTLVRRINEGSGNYQMFSVLGDVILIDREQNTFKLLEEVPIKNLHILPSLTGHQVKGDIFVFLFEYGKNFSGPRFDVFHEQRASCQPHDAYSCNFLHPVIYHYTSLPTEFEMANNTLANNKHPLPEPKRLLHLAEDFFTDFNSREEYIIVLSAFLEESIKQPLYALSQEQCLANMLTHTGSVDHCSQSAMSESWSVQDMQKASL